MKTILILPVALIMLVPGLGLAKEKKVAISGAQSGIHISGTSTSQDDGNVHLSGTTTDMTPKTAAASKTAPAPAKKSKQNTPQQKTIVTQQINDEHPAPGEVRKPRRPQPATVEQPRSPSPPRAPKIPEERCPSHIQGMTNEHAL